MKILIISSYFGDAITGALNFIAEFSRELIQRDHSVSIMLDSRYKSKYNIDNVNFIWFDSTKITK